MTGSRDMTARLYSLDPIEGFQPLTLTGHHGAVLGVYFGREADADVPPGSTVRVCVPVCLTVRPGLSTHAHAVECRVGVY